MPYIKDDDRQRIRTTAAATTPGELNYLFTEAIKTYIAARGLSYQTINDVVGALEGCKLEFYARIARPYEDRKIAENGDVY